MRILAYPAHLRLYPEYGSEYSWVWEILRGLARRSIEVIAIVGRASRSLEIPRRLRIIDLGLRHSEPLIERFMFEVRGLDIAREAIRSADVVHHMMPFGFRAGLNLLAIFRYIKNKTFVIGPIQYPQEYSDLTDFEWISVKEGLRARIFHDLEKAITRLISRPISFLHETTLEEAEALVFDSRKTLNLYKEHYQDLLKDKILEVIPPGVETEIFKYVPPIKKNYFEIMTAGYLVRRKGIQYLIKAMPIILREVREVKLRIVGDGPFKIELMKLVKRLSLDNNIRFEGLLPRNELAKHYANCDVYVQPSLSETFPSTIREAMSVGRPVVATRVGFLEEHIIDGVNGFLVSRKNVEEIAKKVLIILGDEDLRLKMSIKAREYAESNFNWDKIVLAWYNMYHRLFGT